MRIETTLARHISQAERKVAFDQSCKRLLSHKKILAWIMKQCLREYQDEDVDQIAQKYIEGTPQISQTSIHMDEKVSEECSIKGMNTEDNSVEEGKISYDIYFSALTPEKYDMANVFINVEAQKDFYPGYPIIKRGIYYGGRMISRQYGTEFAHSHYEKLKKVYSIWICTNAPKYRQNTITSYSIVERNIVGNVKEKKRNYDLLTVIIICLGTEKDENYRGILKLLDVLLCSKKKMVERKRVLEQDFAIEMSRELEEEVERMCNISEAIEEEATKRGMEKGIKAGIEEGRREGRREGKEKAILQSIQNLMDSLELTTERAMEVLKIPEEQQKYYRELLKKNMQ